MTQSPLVFDPFAETFVRNPHQMFRRLRQEAPVYYNEQLDFYALTRYKDVAAAFKDYQTYSSAGGLDLAMVKSNAPPPDVLIFMDPPEHRRMRNLVSKAFTPRATNSLQSMVIGQVQRYLRMADLHRFDVVEDFSGPFPVDVITRMIGVPEEFSQQVRSWFDEILGQAPGQIEISEAAMRAFAEAGTYFYNLVQERRARPQDDIISALVAAELEREDGETTRLEDHEIVLFAGMLSAAGTETVTKLVSNAMAVFAHHPEQWQRLLDDPAKVPAAVEELLRYDGPVLYNIRRTLKEVTVGGISIPEGKPVLLCLASANRDSDAFPDPDVFDIDRGNTGVQHLGFGTGIHSCLGAALARMETAIALEHLLDFMPRYEVIWQECQRINPTSVVGWSRLPIRILR